MRKNDFLPRLAAAAVIITAIMFSNIFVKAQSNNEYQVVNAKVNQDAWHNEKPCPPCPTFPFTKQESPKRLPGTNGAYVECNPSIIINPAQCQGNNLNNNGNCSGAPVENFANSAWMIWILLLTFALGGIIFWLIANTGKEKSGNSINTYHYYHHYPDVTIKIISFDAPKPKKEEDAK